MTLGSKWLELDNQGLTMLTSTNTDFKSDELNLSLILVPTIDIVERSYFNSTEKKGIEQQVLK